MGYTGSDGMGGQMPSAMVADGGHDFVETPGPLAPGQGPGDLMASPPQEESTPAARVCPDSVPQGGVMPFQGEPKALDAARMPFKLKG